MRTHYLTTLRTALEARALDSEIADAEAERLDAAGRLGQLLGRPGWRPRARGDLTPIDPMQARALLWERVSNEHPAIEAARRKIVAAEAGLAQAKRAWRALSQLETFHQR